MLFIYWVPGDAVSTGMSSPGKREIICVQHRGNVAACFENAGDNRRVDVGCVIIEQSRSAGYWNSCYTDRVFDTDGLARKFAFGAREFNRACSNYRIERVFSGCQTTTGYPYSWHNLANWVRILFQFIVQIEIGTNQFV